MTYSTNLTEVQQVSTPEFYDFLYAGNYEYYTSWETDLIMNGHTYLSTAIRRTPIKIDAAFSSVKMTIEAPLIEALTRYIASTPVKNTEVRLWQALKDDFTSGIVVFEGSILSVQMKKFVAQASCSSDNEILDMYYPNVAYQSFCNHAIYDAGCGLDDSLWRVQKAVTLISGSDYTAPGLTVFPNGYFTGGIARFGGDERMITNHIDDIVTLQVPFDSRVAVGTIVDFYPGCSGNPDVCKNTFNNYDNALVFPYIPSMNPVIWGLD